MLLYYTFRGNRHARQKDKRKSAENVGGSHSADL